MRICLCRRGATRILEFLRAELRDDEILECSQEEVQDAARRVDVLVPLVARIGEDALASPCVRLVQQFGAGLDGVDIESASRHGVYVANVPSAETANADSVAELAVFLMLALARKWCRAQESLRAGRIGAPIGTTLKGKTVAIVGFGGIGRALARRLRAFSLRIVAVSRHGPRDGEAEADLHLPASALHAALEQADFVVVATPLQAETRGLIGHDAFDHMKPGAFLVNIARGPVVEREALLEALRSGKLGGAGLDVFWEEPPDPADPLFSYEVVATPHVGGATEASLQDIARAVAANVNRLRHGEVPRNCVNRLSIDAASLRAKQDGNDQKAGVP
ncbi:MAG TPA: 2-hydroxyacid dehydrogenase [Candidatus Binatia bacterium]|nr:2-hydroxyacid dehydrogenase [Candidatus Binatia bacterium]